MLVDYIRLFIFIKFNIKSVSGLKLGGIQERMRWKGLELVTCQINAWTAIFCAKIYSCGKNSSNILYDQRTILINLKNLKSSFLMVVLIFFIPIHVVSYILLNLMNKLTNFWIGFSSPNTYQSNIITNKHFFSIFMLLISIKLP